MTEEANHRRRGGKDVIVNKLKGLGEVQIVGHSPMDFDSYASVILMSHLCQYLGVKANMVFLDNENININSIINEFGLMKVTVSDYNRDMKTILVDHNDKVNSVKDIPDENIVLIINHKGKESVENEINVNYTSCASYILEELDKRRELLSVEILLAFLSSVCDTLNGRVTGYEDDRSLCILRKKLNGTMYEDKLRSMEIDTLVTNDIIVNKDITVAGSMDVKEVGGYKISNITLNNPTAELVKRIAEEFQYDSELIVLIKVVKGDFTIITNSGMVASVPGLISRKSHIDEILSIVNILRDVKEGRKS